MRNGFLSLTGGNETENIPWFNFLDIFFGNMML